MPPPTTSPTEPAPRSRPPGEWMLVDLDCFFVAVERRRDPSLIGRVVVVGGDPRATDSSARRGVVCCASYEARAYGVRAAMPLTEALRRLPRDAVFLPGDGPTYMRASQEVMAVLRTFTPSVETISLDEAYLDMAGCGAVHGRRSRLEVGAAIRDAVRARTGLTVSIGIATSRVVAKVACDAAKPAGLLEVRPGEEAAFLAPLPLRDLPGVGARTFERLAPLGLRTIGDLAALPADRLRLAFGAYGEGLSLRARGLDALGDGPRPPGARSISRCTTFAHDTCDPDVVDGTLSWLAQRALHALREEGLLVRTVSVRLRAANFETVQAGRRLGAPTDDDATVLAAVRALVARRWNRTTSLRLVGVHLGDLTAPRERQLGLFDAPAAARSAPNVDAALDAIRTRHGMASVVRGRALTPPPTSRDRFGFGGPSRFAGRTSPA